MIAAAGDQVDAPALLASIGLDAEGQWDPKAMIPADTYYDMLERIASLTDVTDLPVRVGASMRLAEYVITLGLELCGKVEKHRHRRQEDAGGFALTP